MPKTKAEISFGKKIKHLTGEDRLSMEENPDGTGRSGRRLPLDTAAVEQVYAQYGAYLELIDETPPNDQVRVFTWPAETVLAEEPEPAA